MGLLNEQFLRIMQPTKMTKGDEPVRKRCFFSKVVGPFWAVCFFVLAGCVSTPLPETHQKTHEAAHPKLGVIDPAMIIASPERVNSEEAKSKPYIILVSIDGYRHDFNRLFQPPNLLRIEKDGVAAESLEPVYPSKTFPNHYSIATGLYANRHGIVSNEFYDPIRKESFRIRDRHAIEDGSWYGGEPIWVTAQKNGILAASFFWVGSEADVLGVRPQYYYRYNDSIPRQKKVDQVVEWLKMPEEKRPHLITLYFHEVDSAVHRYGVMSKEARAAVYDVDKAIGGLREKLTELSEKSGISVQLIIVSDHGMHDLDPKKAIVLDQSDRVSELLKKFHVVGGGPQMLIYLRDGEDPRFVKELERELEKNAKNFRAYNREELKSLHYDLSPRTGDLVIVPELPYLLSLRESPAPVYGANHGWDARDNKSMHGIFYAVGSAFHEGKRIKSFQNIHVYPLVLKILGLPENHEIDGKLSEARSALKP